jgi:hypothetical protein
MTINEYLQATLKLQELPENSTEWKTLITRKKEVEQALRDGFPKTPMTVRYGGSRAKGTLIKESYDLDIVCYLANDDMSAGETLKDIYGNTAEVLGKTYVVLRKKTALRIRDQRQVDFHIDVVPGRFTDDKMSDCFLYQQGGDRERLKTNLDTHIRHVRESGLLDAVRLLKLWKVRKALQVCQFPFELLVLELLADFKNKSLTGQLTHVWTELRDTQKPMVVKDPANSANDLTPMLAGGIWAELNFVAGSTLETIERGGWETVFGKLGSTEERAVGLKVAAATVAEPTKPWCP